MSSTSLSSPRRLLRGLACAFYGMGLALGLPLASTLLLAAETWAGHLYALCALSVCLLPATFLYLRAARKLLGWQGKGHALPLALALAVPCAGVPVLYWQAPSGTSVPGSPVQSVFLDPAGYARWSPWNLLPEIDQVKLGTLVIGGFDPVIDFEQARRLRSLVMPVYRNMEGRQEYGDIGSAMPDGYRDFLGLAYGEGHYYLLMPPSAPGEELPLVLFLHGSWGNFRLYLGAFEEFALKERVAIAFPTLGFGWWHRDESVRTLTRVLEHCLATYPVDPERVYLVGISNGSYGVARAAAALAPRLDGLGFLSPILDHESFETPEFASALAGERVLILHGDSDRRIPVDSVHRGARRLAEQGLRVTLHTYPGEDHFMLLSQRDDVCARLASFIAAE